MQMKHFIFPFALVLFPLTAVAEPVCLHYGDAETLEGALAKRVAYGRPGYGEDPKHDPKYFAYVLHLDEPICVVPSKEPTGKFSGGDDSLIYQVEAIQIWNNCPFFLVQTSTKEKWIDKKHISVSGGLYSWYPAWHVTPVLIEPK
jgi:hypothetical protein